MTDKKNTPESPSYYARYILCSLEIIGRMVGVWSPLVRASIVSDKDGIVELVFREEHPFTSEDVEAVRRAADMEENEDVWAHPAAKGQSTLRNLADRIEALLPPQPSEKPTP